MDDKLDINVNVSVRAIEEAVKKMEAAAKSAADGVTRKGDGSFQGAKEMYAEIQKYVEGETFRILSKAGISLEDISKYATFVKNNSGGISKIRKREVDAKKAGLSIPNISIDTRIEKVYKALSSLIPDMEKFEESLYSNGAQLQSALESPVKFMENLVAETNQQVQRMREAARKIAQIEKGVSARKPAKAKMSREDEVFARLEAERKAQEEEKRRVYEERRKNTPRRLPVKKRSPVILPERKSGAATSLPPGTYAIRGVLLDTGFEADGRQRHDYSFGDWDAEIKKGGPVVSTTTAIRGGSAAVRTPELEIGGKFGTAAHRMHELMKGHNSVRQREALIKKIESGKIDEETSKILQNYYGTSNPMVVKQRKKELFDYLEREEALMDSVVNQGVTVASERAIAATRKFEDGSFVTVPGTIDRIVDYGGGLKGIEDYKTQGGAITEKEIAQLIYYRYVENLMGGNISSMRITHSPRSGIGGGVYDIEGVTESIEKAVIDYIFRQAKGEKVSPQELQKILSLGKEGGVKLSPQSGTVVSTGRSTTGLSYYDSPYLSSKIKSGQFGGAIQPIREIEASFWEDNKDKINKIKSLIQTMSMGGGTAIGEQELKVLQQEVSQNFKIFQEALDYFSETDLFKKYNANAHAFLSDQGGGELLNVLEVVLGGIGTSTDVQAAARRINVPVVSRIEGAMVDNDWISNYLKSDKGVEALKEKISKMSPMQRSRVLASLFVNKDYTSGRAVEIEGFRPFVSEGELERYNITEDPREKASIKGKILQDQRAKALRKWAIENQYYAPDYVPGMEVSLRGESNEPAVDELENYGADEVKGMTLDGHWISEYIKVIKNAINEGDRDMAEHKIKELEKAARSIGYYGKDDSYGRAGNPIPGQSWQSAVIANAVYRAFVEDTSNENYHKFYDYVCDIADGPSFEEMRSDGVPYSRLMNSETEGSTAEDRMLSNLLANDRINPEVWEEEQRRIENGIAVLADEGGRPPESPEMTATKVGHRLYRLFHYFEQVQEIFKSITDKINRTLKERGIDTQYTVDQVASRYLATNNPSNFVLYNRSKELSSKFGYIEGESNEEYLKRAIGLLNPVYKEEGEIFNRWADLIALPKQDSKGELSSFSQEEAKELVAGIFGRSPNKYSLTPSQEKTIMGESVLWRGEENVGDDEFNFGEWKRGIPLDESSIIERSVASGGIRALAPETKIDKIKEIAKRMAGDNSAVKNEIEHYAEYQKMMQVLFDVFDYRGNLHKFIKRGQLKDVLRTDVSGNFIGELDLEKNEVLKAIYQRAKKEGWSEDIDSIVSGMAGFSPVSIGSESMGIWKRAKAVASSSQKQDEKDEIEVAKEEIEKERKSNLNNSEALRILDEIAKENMEKRRKRAEEREKIKAKLQTRNNNDTLSERKLSDSASFFLGGEKEALLLPPSLEGDFFREDSVLLSDKKSREKFKREWGLDEARGDYYYKRKDGSFMDQKVSRRLLGEEDLRRIEKKDSSPPPGGVSISGGNITINGSPITVNGKSVDVHGSSLKIDTEGKSSINANGPIEISGAGGGQSVISLTGNVQMLGFQANVTGGRSGGAGFSGGGRNGGPTGDSVTRIKELLSNRFKLDALIEEESAKISLFGRRGTGAGYETQDRHIKARDEYKAQRATLMEEFEDLYQNLSPEAQIGVDELKNRYRQNFATKRASIRGKSVLQEDEQILRRYVALLKERENLEVKIYELETKKKTDSSLTKKERNEINKTLRAQKALLEENKQKRGYERSLLVARGKEESALYEEGQSDARLLPRKLGISQSANRRRDTDTLREYVSLTKQQYELEYKIVQLRTAYGGKTDDEINAATGGQFGALLSKQAENIAARSTARSYLDKRKMSDEADKAERDALAGAKRMREEQEKSILSLREFTKTVTEIAKLTADLTVLNERINAARARGTGAGEEVAQRFEVTKGDIQERLDELSARRDALLAGYDDETRKKAESIEEEVGSKQKARITAATQREKLSEDNVLITQYNRNLQERLRLEGQISSNVQRRATSMSGTEIKTLDTAISLEKQRLAILQQEGKELSDNLIARGREDAVSEANEDFALQRTQLLAEKSTNMHGARNLFDMIGYDIKRSFAMIFDYGLAYRAIGSIRTAFQGVIQDIRDMDAAMVDLRIVTGDTKEETEDLMKSYNGLAKELGATTVEIAKASNEWLRQGYSAQEAESLITGSMYLSKLGMIDASQATEYLTSLLKGFRLEANQVNDAVSLLTQLDMRYAASASDIAEGLSRTATTAQMAGMSLEEAASAITIIKDVSQKSASSIGESIFYYG